MIPVTTKGPRALLAITDASRLTAKHTLAPPAEARERGPIVQEWDLKLAGS